MESFALNGRVGDIGIKDKTIEVKLVFPNDERTQDELAFLFPIKKGLATVRIIAAVNVGYSPGRRRALHDEVGTPLLPGVDMTEICHACGKTVDCVNEPFFAKPVEGGKEIILCDGCYRVPQPETIETPAAAKEEDKNPVCQCGHTKDDHDFAAAWICRAPECYCTEFKNPPILEPAQGSTPEQLEKAADTAKAHYHGPCSVCGTEYMLFFSRANHPIGSACPKCQPEEYARLEKAADEDVPVEGLQPQEPLPGSTPEQLEAAADAILEGAPPVPKVCALCGHPHGERYRIDGEDKKAPRRVWKTIENDQGVFEQCPKCAHLNQFPEEGGGDAGKAA